MIQLVALRVLETIYLGYLQILVAVKVDMFLETITNALVVEFLNVILAH